MMIIMMVIVIMIIIVITVVVVVVVVVVDMIYYHCCCNRIVKYVRVFVRMDQNLDQTCEEQPPLTPALSTTSFSSLSSTSRILNIQ